MKCLVNAMVPIHARVEKYIRLQLCSEVGQDSQHPFTFSNENEKLPLLRAEGRRFQSATDLYLDFKTWRRAEKIFGATSNFAEQGQRSSIILSMPLLHGKKI